jgi:hypothetical protein
LLSKSAAVVTAAVALLAACGDERPASHDTAPTATRSADPQSAEQLLSVMRAGDEATLNGSGSRTVNVTVRTRSAFDFGCVGTGALRLTYGPTEQFTGACYPNRISGLTTNLDIDHYPARVAITIAVDVDTKWRLTIDSHPTDFIGSP